MAHLATCSYFQQIIFEPEGAVGQLYYMGMQSMGMAEVVLKCETTLAEFCLGIGKLSDDDCKTYSTQTVGHVCCSSCASAQAGPGACNGDQLRAECVPQDRNFKCKNNPVNLEECS